MEIAQTAVFVSIALGIVFTLTYLYLMSNCAHVLAYFAIGLIELIFLAGIAGNLYGAFRVNDGRTGFFVGAGVIALGFVVFNILLCCYW